LNVKSLGVEVEGSASTTDQPTAADHLTRKDYVDSQDALKLDKTGGDVTGNIILDNSIPLQSRLADTTPISLATVTAGNLLVFGESSTNLLGVIFGGGTGTFSWRDAANADLMTLAQDGTLSLPAAPTLPEHVVNKAYLDAMFPIGTVVLRGNDTDPNASLPGTWVSKGTAHSLSAVPVGAGAGTVGGVNDVAVPVPEHTHGAGFTGDALPGHGHDTNTHVSSVNPGGGVTSTDGGLWQTVPTNGISAGTPTGVVDISFNGTPGAAMNVRGATYLVVAWERTA